VNSLWHGVELGYIYAHNKIESFNTANFIANCDDNCWIADPGNMISTPFMRRICFRT
jgi:hypothetical protein